MASSKKVQELLGQMQKNLECAICLDMLKNPVSTSCGHQFCRFCLLEFLERKRQVPCPLCKKPVTKRSLTERSHLGNIVDGVHKLIMAFQSDTGAIFSPLRGSQKYMLSSTPESIPTKASGGKAVPIRKTCPVRKGPQRRHNEPVSSESTANNSSISLDSPVCSNHVLSPLKKQQKEAINVSDKRTRAGKSNSKIQREVTESNKLQQTNEKCTMIKKETCDGASNAKALLRIIGNGDLCGRPDKEASIIHCSRISERNRKQNKQEENSISKSENDETDEVTSDCTNNNIKSDVGNSFEASTGKKKLNLKDGNPRKAADLPATNNTKAVRSFVTPGSTEERQIKAKLPAHKHALKEEFLSTVVVEEETESSPEDGTSLFRTPVAIRKSAKKVSPNKETQGVRSLRSRNKPTESLKADDKEMDGEETGMLTPDTVGNEVHSFESSVKEIQHTYSRKGKSSIKDGKVNKKVVAWLQSIPPVETDISERQENGAEASKQSEDKSSNGKRFQRLRKLEESMGMKIRHLAENQQEENTDFFGFDQLENGSAEITTEKGSTVDNTVNINTKSVECHNSENQPVVKRRKIFKSRPLVAKEDIDNGVHDIINISDCDSGSVSKLLPKERLLKLENITVEPGENSDPYEFKSSQRTPKKIKRRGKGQKRQKKKENIYSVTNKPKSVELKSCLKIQKIVVDQNVIDIQKGSSTLHSDKNIVNKAKKVMKEEIGTLNPVVDSTQGEIQRVTTNLEQAEDYDLVTCTQDAIASMAAEQDSELVSQLPGGTKTSKDCSQKKVTFREPVISEFFHNGKIDLVAYREAKKNTCDITDVEDKRADQVIDSLGQTLKDPPSMNGERQDSMNKAEVNPTAESDDDMSDDWRFPDDSSGTDDLEIEPKQGEFEVPNLDIQSEDVKALLSQDSQANEQVKDSEDVSKVTVIEETPLVFKVPSFATSTSNRENRRKKSGEAVHKDAIDTVTIVKETPLIFSVPNFPDKSDSDNGCLETDENTHSPCKGSQVEEAPMFVATPVHASSKSDMESSIHTTETTDSQSYGIHNSPTNQLKRLDEAKVQPIDASVGVVEESSKIDIADVHHSLSLVRDSKIDNVESCIQNAGQSEGCIENNSNVIDSDQTQAPVTQSSMPEGTTENALKETEPFTAEDSSNAIETGAPSCGIMSQNSESILFPKTIAAESPQSSKSPRVINSATSSNATSSSKSLSSKGKRKKRKCFMIDDTPESLDFGSLPEQLPAEDSESKKVTPKRRRFNRLKKGSGSPHPSCSLNDLMNQSTEENMNDVNNAIEEKGAGSDNIVNGGQDERKSSSKLSVSGDFKRGEVKYAAEIDRMLDQKDNNKIHHASPSNCSEPELIIFEEQEHSQVSVITIDSLSQSNAPIDIEKGSVNIIKEIDVEDEVNDIPQLDSEDIRKVEKDMYKNIENEQNCNNSKIATCSDFFDKTDAICRTKVQSQNINGITNTQSQESMQSVVAQTGQGQVPDKFRMRHTSSLYISPDDMLNKSTNFCSPEDIFELGGEMPTVDCSPLENTLEKISLSQVLPKNKKSDAIAISDYKESKCTVNTEEKGGQNFDLNSSNNVGNSMEDSISNHQKVSEVTKLGKNPNLDLANHQREPKAMEEADISPIKKKRPAVRAARGFSKRNRLSDESSGSSTPVKNTTIASPRTPNSCNVQKYKSPVATFISPKLRTKNRGIDEGNATLMEDKKLQSSCQTSPYAKYGLSFQKRNVPKASSLHQHVATPEVVDMEETEESDNSSVNSNSQRSLPDLISGNSDEKNHSLLLTKHLQTPKFSVSPKLVLKCPDLNKLVCKDADRECVSKVPNVERAIDDTQNSSDGCNTSRSVIPDSMTEDQYVEEESKTPQNHKSKIPEEDYSKNAKTSEVNSSKSYSQMTSVCDRQQIGLQRTDNNSHMDNGESELSFVEETMRNSCTQNSEIDDERCAKQSRDNLNGRHFEMTQEHSNTGKISVCTDDAEEMHKEVVMESDIEGSDGDEDSDHDSEDVVRPKKSRKSVLSESSSEDEDDSSRHMNMTSSSAFSSQSENLTTQERIAMEKDLERMAKEMAAMKAQLRKSRMSEAAVSKGTMADTKPTTVDADDDSDAIEVDNSDNEADGDIFLSLPPLSPGEVDTIPPTMSPGVDDMIAPSLLDEKNTADSVPSLSTKNRGDVEVPDEPPQLSPAEQSVLPRQPLADLGVNRSPVRSIPARKHMAFVATGLTAVQLQETKKLAAANEIKLYNKFNESVTHVIVKPAEDDETLCDRTLKLFQGITRGCWIVNFFWVSDSLQVGRLLPEGPYEIQGDTANGETHQGPRRSRLSKTKLLNNIEFALVGDNNFLSRDAIVDLIQACGGHMVKDVSKVGQSHRTGFVVNCSDLDEEDKEAHMEAIRASKDIYRKYGQLMLTREWLLDSMTLYEIQPLDDYIITEGNNLNIPDIVSKII